MHNTFCDVQALRIKTHFDGMLTRRYIFIARKIICTGNIGRFAINGCRPSRIIYFEIQLYRLLGEEVSYTNWLGS